MADVSILELSSLRERHPKVLFLEQFGANAAVRLALDPVALPPDVSQRDMIVERRTPRTNDQEIRELCKVGWKGFSRDDCLKARRTSNQHRISEDAAYAIMALLIHELEGATIEQNLEIGSGGDYILSLAGIASPAHVEVSGVRENTIEYARSRLREKLDQVRVGYASVTTFHCLVEGSAHSFLHHTDSALIEDKT